MRQHLDLLSDASAVPPNSSDSGYRCFSVAAETSAAKDEEFACPEGVLQIHSQYIMYTGSFLGRGATANVKRAIYTVDGKEKPVAIKEWVYPDEAGEEIKIHSQLAHEYVIRVIGLVFPPLKGLVMELADGTLADCLNAKSGPCYEEYIYRLDLALQLASIISYLFDQRIVHRDLKPENILMLQGRLKLTDFGHAAEVDDDGFAISKKQSVGTYGYIDPALFLPGGKTGFKSDIFSLGVVLYSLFAGCLAPITEQHTPEGRAAMKLGRVKESLLPPLPLNEPHEGTSRACFFKAAHRCARTNPDERFSITEAQECLLEARKLYTA